MQLSYFVSLFFDSGRETVLLGILGESTRGSSGSVVVLSEVPHCSREANSIQAKCYFTEAKEKGEEKRVEISIHVISRTVHPIVINTKRLFAPPCRLFPLLCVGSKPCDKDFQIWAVNTKVDA